MLIFSVSFQFFRMHPQREQYLLGRIGPGNWKYRFCSDRGCAVPRDSSPLRTLSHTQHRFCYFYLFYIQMQHRARRNVLSYIFTFLGDVFEKGSVSGGTQRANKLDLGHVEYDN